MYKYKEKESVDFLPSSWRWVGCVLIALSTASSRNNSKFYGNERERQLEREYIYTRIAKILENLFFFEKTDKERGESGDRKGTTRLIGRWIVAASSIEGGERARARGAVRFILANGYDFYPIEKSFLVCFWHPYIPPNVVGWQKDKRLMSLQLFFFPFPSAGARTACAFDTSLRRLSPHVHLWNRI